MKSKTKKKDARTKSPISVASAAGLSKRVKKLLSRTKVFQSGLSSRVDGIESQLDAIKADLARVATELNAVHQSIERFAEAVNNPSMARRRSLTPGMFTEFKRKAVTRPINKSAGLALSRGQE